MSEEWKKEKQRRVNPQLVGVMLNSSWILVAVLGEMCIDDKEDL